MTEIQTNTPTYQHKIDLLKPWLPSILSQIKKDLRQEHLSKDRTFCQKYFPGQNIHRLQPAEMAQAYETAIAAEEQGEQIAEFVFHRWLLKHTDVYHFFEKQLSAITKDFTAIVELTVEQGFPIQEQAVANFGAEAAYIFSIVNSVVFNPSTMETLRQKALATLSQQQENSDENQEQRSWEKKVQDYETRLARINDRCEKKIAGWEHKYDQDMTALKKQIASLQRQLQDKR